MLLTLIDCLPFTPTEAPRWRASYIGTCAAREIPVATPRAGTVKSILVEEKQQVAEGQAVALLQF